MKFNIIKNNKIVLILLLLLALLLRLIAISQSFWLDETISAETAKNFSYTGIITEFAKFDFHPPFYYLFLKFWSSFFGYSEISLRFPSVLFGLLTVIITYKITLKIRSKTDNLFPLLSVLLLTTSQIHIYYSQEARMYSMAAFLASLTIYLFIKITDRETDYISWILFSLAITFLIITDYVPVLLLPIFVIAALIERKQLGWWKKFALTFIPLISLGFLWLPTLLIQLQGQNSLKASLPMWNSIIGGNSIKDLGLVWAKFVFGRISLANKLLYFGILLFTSFIFIMPFMNVVGKFRKKLNLLFLWLFIPLGLGFVVSFFFPVLKYFRFLYILPAFYILISFGVSKFNYPTRRLLTPLLLALNLISWSIYVLDPRQQRENWREASLVIEKKVASNEIILFAYPDPITPFRWYSSGISEAEGGTDSIPANPDNTSQKTHGLVKDKSGVFYFEYLRDISDPGRVVENTLLSEGFSVKEVYNFTGVGQVFHYIIR